MKRWSGDTNKEFPKVDAFLKEIKKVCKKHGFSISHEDEQGSFIIEEYRQSNIDWLNAASYKREE